MSECKIPLAQVQSVLLNKDKLGKKVLQNYLEEIKTAEDLSFFIDAVSNAISEDNSKYKITVAGDDTDIKNTISQPDIAFRTTVSQDRNIVDNANKFIHKIINLLNNEIYTKIVSENGSATATKKLKSQIISEILKNNTSELLEFGILFNKTEEGNALEKTFSTLFDTVLFNIENAFSIQNMIDNTKLPIVKFNVNILNPVNNTAGTVNMLTIYSDKTIGITSYNMFIPLGNTVDWKAAEGATVAEPLSFGFDRLDVIKSEVPKYAKIMDNAYGSKARFARAVPISIAFDQSAAFRRAIYRRNLKEIEALRNKGNTLDNLINGIETFTSPGAGGFLTPIGTIEESVATGERKKFIESRYKQIKELKHKLEVGKLSVEEKNELKREIFNLESALSKLILFNEIHEYHSRMYLIKEKISNYYKNNKDNLDLGILNEIKSEVGYFASIGALSNELSDSLESVNYSAPTIISSILRIATELSHVVDGYILEALMQDNVFEDYKKMDINQILSDGILFEADEFFQFYAKGAGNSNNPFFKAMKRIKDNTEFTSRKTFNEFLETSEKINKAVNEWKKTNGWTDKQFSDFMLELSNKKNNLKLFSKLKKEFWELIDKNINFNENGIPFDDAIEFFTNNFTVKENYADRFKERFEYYESVIRKSILKATIDLENEVITKHTFEQRIGRLETKFGKWLRQNSIYSYTIELDPKTLTFKFKENKGILNFSALNKINTKAWLKPTKAFEDKYLTDKYKFLQLNKPLMDWYNHHLGAIAEAQRIYGYSKNISSTFAPYVLKETFESMMSGSRAAKLNFLDSISTTSYGNYETTNSDGTVNNSIPINFLAPILKKVSETEYEVDTKRLSTNLELNLLQFMAQTYRYEQLQKEEATVMALRQLMIDYGQIYETTPSGEIIEGVGKLSTKAIKIEDEIVKAFDAYVNFYWYGKKIQSKDKSIKIGETEVSRNRALLEAKNLYSKMVLGWNIYPAAAAGVVGKVLTKILAKKGLSFSMKEYNEASKIMTSLKTRGLSNADNTEKAAAFLQFFDTYTDSPIKNLKFKYSKSSLDKYFGDRSQFALMSWGDEFNSDVIAIALAKHYYFIDGKLRNKTMLTESEIKNNKSLYDSITMKEGSIDFGNLTEDQIKYVWITFRQIAREAQRSVMGTMNDDEIALYSTHILWNMVSQFKTFLPNIAYEFMKGLRYDDVLDVVDIGRFTALADRFREVNLENKNVILSFLKMLLQYSTDLVTFWKPIKLGEGGEYTGVEVDKARRIYDQWVAKHPQLAKKVSFENYAKARARQTAALVGNIRLIILLLLLYAVAMRIDLDDDDTPDLKEIWLGRSLLRIFNRVYTESAAMYSAEAANTLLGASNTIVPVFGLATKTWKLAENFVDEILDIFKKEDKKDNTYPFYYTLDFVYPIDRVRKFLELSEADRKATR